MNKKFFILILAIFLIAIYAIFSYVVPKKVKSELPRTEPVVIKENKLDTRDNWQTEIESYPPSGERWKTLLGNWNSLKPKDKEEFKELADEIVFIKRLPGLEVQPFSNQDKNVNLYYQYASSRIKNLANPEKLNADWLEPIFKRIPLWLQYAYAFENKKEVAISNKIIPTLLDEYQAGKISLWDVASYLNTFQRYPVESLKLLPLVLYAVKTDTLNLIQSNKNSDKAMAFAIYAILSKLKTVSLDESIFLKIPEEISLTADIFERAETAKYILAGIYYLPIETVQSSEKTILLAKKLAYELMMILEPDGCLPQLGGIRARVNYRETLFHAAEFFKTNDLRFVSQGSFRNDDCNPPIRNDIWIKDCGYFASKSTWNLLDIIPEYPKAQAFQQFLGADASQVTVDSLNQEISFYAFGKPLIKIKLKGIKLPVDKMVVIRQKEMQIDNQTYVTDEIQWQDEKIKILFIRKINSVIISNENPNLMVEINSFRSQIINDLTVKTIKTLHQKAPMVFYSYTHEEKHKGDCYIKGEYAIDILEDSSKPLDEEGYFNKVVLSKVKNIILEGKPFLLPDMELRRVFGDNRIHEIADVSLENGEIQIKKSATKLTVGRFR